MIKVMLTNITLIVNEWQHSNFRKALTRNFTQPLTLNAISSMITSYKVTCWQKAVKHLQKRNNDVSVYLFENRPFKIPKLCKKRFSGQMWIFLKNCCHVTAVSLTHLSFFIFMFSLCSFWQNKWKNNHSRVVSALTSTLSWNKKYFDSQMKHLYISRAWVLCKLLRVFIERKNEIWRKQLHPVTPSF